MERHALSVAAILNDRSPVSRRKNTSTASPNPLADAAPGGSVPLLSSTIRPKSASLSFIVNNFNNDSETGTPKGKRRVRLKCTAEGCTKIAKARGKCNTHGGGQSCSGLNCKNFAVSHGKCITHGGGKRCSVSGCTHGAKANSLCWKHGGSITCKIPGCDRGGKTGGLCWSHGGGKLCSELNCTKVALKGGRCWAHGGGNRCSREDCPKPCVRKSSYCRKHHID